MSGSFDRSIASVTPTPLGHLQGVPGQPEAGHVGRGVHTDGQHRVAGRLVELDHAVAGGLEQLGRALLAFAAVVTKPVPSGLVSTSTSPGLAVALVRMRSGWIVPVTARPNLISASRTVCPPTTVQPAAAQRSAPPARIGRASRNAELVVGVAGEVQRGDGRAAHRVDVAERVGGGDLAVDERVVHDRREKVDRLHDARGPAVSRKTPASSCVSVPTSRSG